MAKKTKKSNIKYEDISAVYNSDDIKSCKSMLKTLEEKQKEARLSVAKKVFLHENGKATVEEIHSALGFEDYIANMIDRVTDNIEFLEKSENILLDSADILEIQKKYKFEKEEKEKE